MKPSDLLTMALEVLGWLLLLAVVGWVTLGLASAIELAREMLL